MKNSILVIIISILLKSTAAQITITPGAQFYMNGNTQLTLQNADLVNNGNFSAGNGTVSFTGNTSSSITGSQPVQFYQLEINKTSGVSLSLQRAIGVEQQINFTSGFIDLNGNNLDLGSTGTLNGEQESSHIIGVNGGKVLLHTILNAPSALNPGNLGAIITSSQNLGNVVISRGHQSQVNASGGGNSILRYYDIAPANNSGLDATLRFRYFDNELNGLTEGSLVFWSSTDSTQWTNQGFTTNNTTTDYVEKTGIPSFSRWTLSGITNALPVRFILFNTACEGNTVRINWKTAQEQNSSYYNIETSADGSSWTVIARLSAAGTTNTESNYLFTDNHPLPNSYYRIAEYDLDGRSQLTKVLRTDCSNQGVFSVWPNPVSDILYINLSSATGSNALVKIFDGKGALVRQQAEKLLPGNNLLSINVKGVASGLYYTTISYNNGQLQMKKIVIK